LVYDRVLHVEIAPRFVEQLAVWPIHREIDKPASHRNCQAQESSGEDQRLRETRLAGWVQGLAPVVDCFATMPNVAVSDLQMAVVLILNAT
jgi:hypothetical protein